MGKIIIYTDGACSNNGYEGARGGWAFIIAKDNIVIYQNSGAQENTTNQRMELLSVINACEFIEDMEIYSDNNTQFNIGEIEVYSDSAYLINCYLQKWYDNWEKNCWMNAKKQPVANKDLWERLIPFFRNRKFSFLKVKGHSGIEYNELCDKLAVQARSKNLTFSQNGCII